MPFIDLEPQPLGSLLETPKGAFVTQPHPLTPWWKNPVDVGAAVTFIVVLTAVAVIVARRLAYASNRALRARKGRQPATPQRTPSISEQPNNTEFDPALWQRAKEIADRREPELPLPEYFEIHLGLIIAISIVVFCGLAGIDVERHPTALIVTTGIGAAIPAGMRYRQTRRNSKILIEQYRHLIIAKSKG